MPRRIPASVTSAYNRAVKAQGDAASKAVRQALGEFFRENPAATVEEAREYAIQLLQGAGDLYGAAASQAAFDLLQNVAYVDGVPMPDLGSWFYEADAEAIDRTAHYHAGKLVDGDVQGFIDQISAAARECAERGANESMGQAARAQARGVGKRGGRRKGAAARGIHFARVPMGPTTCPFCLMLASRGFVYLSEESAGEFDRFHRHCDCRIVPGTADTKVDGYDPAELYDRWKHPEKYEEESAGAPTTRQQLEQEARRAYIANGGGMGLSEAEAAERFDLLVDGNTDAQLRKYIREHGVGSDNRQRDETSGHSRELEERFRENASQVNREAMVDSKWFEDAQTRGVHWDKVDSKDYTAKMAEIVGDKDMARIIHDDVKAILKKTDKTPFEELYAYDLTAGERIERVIDQRKPLEVVPTEKFKARVQERIDAGHRVVTLHNHSGSNIPSLADIHGLKVRGDEFGIVACHNGEIFTYRVVGEPAEGYIIDSSEEAGKKFLGSFMDRMIKKGFDAALQDVGELYGVKFERFL